jgi:DNA-binding Xre family transcriptional regulator
MSRSAKLHPERKQQILQALKRHGFLTQGYLASHLQISLSTVNNFINSKPVYISKFEEICEALNLNPQEMIQPLNNAPQTPEITHSRIDFLAYDSCWVGRENIVKTLTDQLKLSCRLLVILGLTGIGKTALAERITFELENTFALAHNFQRISFEYSQYSFSFTTFATNLLQSLNVPVKLPEQKPEQLLWHLIHYLQHNPCIILIDSLENVLTGNENDGWGNFADSYWERFFLTILSSDNFVSKIIITSQDLPLQLVQQRSHKFWYSHILTGLTDSEQETLFALTGFDMTNSSDDKPLLMRIGQAYQGHPLVLRVIIGEIWESFRGNVKAYWDEVKSKIETVENTLAEAETEVKQNLGIDDNWQLHKLTLKVRLEVNKQRLNSVFERLAKEVPDAYWLICCGAVYRSPVQVQGWLMQLIQLVKRLEKQSCSEERQEKALIELSHRFLLEQSINHNNKRVLGLHHIIRSVALEHYHQLISTFLHK